MKFPTIKQFQQWLPMFGGATFTLWTGFLVVLSLFPNGKEALPGPDGTKQTPVAASACVTMTDGFSICDEISTPRLQQ